MVFVFNFISKHIFQSGCSKGISFYLCIKVSVSSNSFQHLVLSTFSIFFLSGWCKSYLSLLIYITWFNMTKPISTCALTVDIFFFLKLQLISEHTGSDRPHCWKSAMVIAREKGRWGKEEEGVEGNKQWCNETIFGDKHTIQYTDEVLWNYTPKTYMMGCPNKQNYLLEGRPL